MERNSGVNSPEVYHHLHCFKLSIKLQVVLTAPGHQMVNLTPVGRLIPLRNEPNEGGVIRNVSSLTDW